MSGTPQISKAVKKAERKLAKREVKKEVRRELLQKTRPPRQRKKKAGAIQSSIETPMTTTVVGTGVVAPQNIAGKTPYRNLKLNGKAADYGSTDYLGTVSVSSTNVIGDILFSFKLNPLLATATRTAQEASQWERYRVKEWCLRFVAMNGTETDGQTLAFIEPDPQDAWSNSALNMNKASAQYGSVPDNVWKHFKVCLPIVPGVPDFYTNPLTTSDPRFSVAGVAYVIYAGGVKFPSGTTTVNLFNVWQDIDLEFYQPELTLAASSAMSSGTTTTPTIANILNGIKVAGVVPVNVTSDGTVQIDTGSLGGNNIVAEIISTAQSAADVAGIFGIDWSAGSSALDAATQVVRLAQQSLGLAGETISQVLLPGNQSWQLSPTSFGVTNANLLQTVLNLFVVPSAVVTLGQASKLTKQRVIAAADTNSGGTWTISGNVGPNSANHLVLYDLVHNNSGVSNRVVTDAGLDMTFSESSGKLSFLWHPTSTSDVVVVSYMHLVPHWSTASGNAAPPPVVPLSSLQGLSGNPAYNNFVPGVSVAAGASSGEFMYGIFDTTTTDGFVGIVLNDINTTSWNPDQTHFVSITITVLQNFIEPSPGVLGPSPVQKSPPPSKEKEVGKFTEEQELILRQYIGDPSVRVERDLSGRARLVIDAK